MKRDTPAGRAALVRRRQRAAAVVEHSARFVPDSNQSEDDDSNLRAVSATSEDSSVPDDYLHQQQQRGTQPDPPPQQQRSSRSNNPAAPPSSGSYSTATLPSSNELLERSSQVALEAAAVLASARKQKQGYSEPPTTSAAGPASRTANSPLSPHQATIASFLRRDERNNDDTQEEVSGMDAPSDPYTDYHPQDPPPVQQQLPPQSYLEKQQFAATPPPKKSYLERQGDGYYEEPPENEARYQQQQQYQDTDSQDMAEDNDDDTMLEEDVTMEEMEPVFSKETEDEVVDTACIVSGSSIMLRSMATSATVVTISEAEAALAAGAGLGTVEETLQIVKVALAGVEEVDDGNECLVTILQSANGAALPLRWGDTVALLSSDPSGRHNDNIANNTNNGEPKALGIRRHARESSSNRPVDYEIGWFQSTLGQPETWTILRGLDNSNHGVRVGLSAMDRAEVLAQRRVDRGQCTHIVQSGDPILMRHTQTGGLLSVNMAAEGLLQLVTDSYDPSRNFGRSYHSSSGGTSSGLLSQLQRHNRYLPAAQDTFALVKSSVPPCPRWILAGGTSTSANQTYNPRGHRMYLHQTYLTISNRNDQSQVMQEQLFGRQWASLSMESDQGPIQQRMELPDQESLLIDEVIGACLGLEGKYICARSDNEAKNTHSNISKPQTIEFCLKEGSDQLFDASIRNLIEKLLPLATSYVHVSAFVASHLPGYEFGSVVQAFCEAVDGMLQEYAAYIAEMEQRFRQQPVGDFLTLRRLHAQLIPSLHSMSVLERATSAVRDKTGGALINSLSTLKAWSCEGDNVANQVIAILLDRASIPYMTMLTTWLQHGLLRDPYAEFMIEIKDQDTNGRSNFKHSADSDFNKVSYKVREEHCLTELLSSDVLLQKVVATGKYWRAVRDCEVALRKKTQRTENADEARQTTTVLQYSLSFNSISSFIHLMYEGASQALVHLLMEDFCLIDALRSMKNYFLFGHGDFLGILLDSAEDELVKELGDVSTGRIQHWLRMSIQMTEAHSESRRPLQGSTGAGGEESKRIPEKSLSPMALRCRFQPFSLINHVEALHEGKTSGGNKRSGADESMLNTPSRDAYGTSKGLTGVETFVLDFPAVPFPISLVLSDGSLDKYQLLFRLLFFAKYVERRLVSIWQDHQAMKELNSIRGLFGPTFLLRQRMLHFAQNLIYYMMFEVIEPNWMGMEEVIANPDTTKKTVDDIVDVHEAFLQQTLEACLLTNKELVRTLTKLMTTCLMFADQMKLFTEATKIVSFLLLTVVAFI